MQHKFEIERATWLRGDDSGYSCLLDRNGKRCCLGFYLQSVGVDDSSMKNVGSPRMVDGFLTPATHAIASAMQWLVDAAALADNLPGAASSCDCTTLMHWNDMPPHLCDEYTREQKITELFAAHDIDVTFV